MAGHRKLQVSAREKVEQLRAEGKSYRAIASELGVHHRTLIRNVTAWRSPRDMPPEAARRCQLRLYSVLGTAPEFESFRLADNSLYILTNGQRLAVQRFISLLWRERGKSANRKTNASHT